MPHLHPDWQLNSTQTALHRAFVFDNFYATMAFVNAVAWIAHSENHHPDLEVGYNTCRITYTTHSLNGLSPLDYICAGKIDALTAQN